MAPDRSTSHMSSQSKALPISSSPSSYSRGRDIDSDRATSRTRYESTARLASPIPAPSHFGTPPVRQLPLPSASQSSTAETQAPLPGAASESLSQGPGRSALAAAFEGSLGTKQPQLDTPPLRPLSPHAAGKAIEGPQASTTYGSFDIRSNSGTPIGNDADEGYTNLDVVKRHLVQPEDSTNVSESGARGRSFSRGPSHKSSQQQVGLGINDDEFSSLRLQGGDMTREVYRWAEEMDEQGKPRNQRSKSFFIPRPEPPSDVLDISTIKVPGGFRRDYLRRAAGSPSPSAPATQEGDRSQRTELSNFTSSFMEFLSLYGHFAGEELNEDDENLGPGEYYDSGASGDEDEATERSGLLRRPGSRRRPQTAKPAKNKAGNTYTVFLLLKSFIGTGVLFLPRAFLNGGMLFSNIVLLVIAFLCFYCFVLLINTRSVVHGSFGDLGQAIYGKTLRNIILFSLVISQIGFSSAYIVFTAQNLQAFVESVSGCRTSVSIGLMILAQMFVFLPFSLLRAIKKLSGVAIFADFLIVMGLVYLYYYNIFTIGYHHGLADIKAFNPKDWTVFIGTAVFTFEGVGLIIPIQEGMKKPQSFTPLLAMTMVIVTAVYLTMASLAYGAFGSATKTVILLNLPGDSHSVQGVQFVYSIAIMLSTPLQMFPAIRILETATFARSGKFNPNIKWKKNAFRFLFVMVCCAIAYGGASNLDKFVAIIGSFACIPLVYIYPPMLHYKAVAESRRQKIADSIIIILGVVLMTYTSGQTIYGWIIGGGEAKTPSYCELKRHQH